MPTRSCSADLTKSRCCKRLYISHEAIAGRAWINGIGFDNGRSALLGVLHRCFDDLFRQSLSAQLSTNKKADQRPHLLRPVAGVVRTAQVTVCRPRGDRAPCNGLTFGIAEQPDRACHRRHISVSQLSDPDPSWFWHRLSTPCTSRLWVHPGSRTGARNLSSVRRLLRETQEWACGSWWRLCSFVQSMTAKGPEADAR
jgi:hypothetical protein